MTYLKSFLVFYLEQIVCSAALFLAATNPCWAQFDPAKTLQEPPQVAQRFPDPEVRYPTPAFQPGRADLTSHAEVLAFLESLARQSSRIQVQTIGQSQRGLPMPMALLSAKGYNPALPTVMVIAQQHGNEPAGGEAALALAQQLAGPRSALLEATNVLIIPRGNPDGAERFVRATHSGVDVNRDHLLLRTPEARAIAAATLRYPPQVVLDLHEFTVAGRWVDKFAAMQKYDALVQGASVGNLHAPLAAATQTGYVDRLHQVWAANGLASFAYHTTSPDVADKTVAMGGVQPDTGRNTSGLRPAVSLLVELRGVGLGRAHLLRRVHTGVLAGLAVVETAAAQGDTLTNLVRQAGADTAAAACQGDLVIAARHQAVRQAMVFVDATTGADKTVEVDWRAATPLEVLRTRPRPCGYLLAASQTDALQRLRLLGVRMQPVMQAAPWVLERYAVTSENNGQRQDARGAIDDGGDANIRLLQVGTARDDQVIAPGSAIYVPMDQPLAGLVAAALEPDSQSSYAANRLLHLAANSGPQVNRATLWRVLAKPVADLLGPR